MADTHDKVQVKLDDHQSRILLERIGLKISQIFARTAVVDDNISPPCDRNDQTIDSHCHLLAQYVYTLLVNQRSMYDIAVELQPFFARRNDQKNFGAKCSSTDFVYWLVDEMVSLTTVVSHKDNRSNSSVSTSHNKEVTKRLSSTIEGQLSSSAPTEDADVTTATERQSNKEVDPRVQVLNNGQLRDHFQDLHKSAPDQFPKYLSVYQFNQLRLKHRTSNVYWLIEREDNEWNTKLSQRVKELAEQKRWEKSRSSGYYSSHGSGSSRRSNSSYRYRPYDQSSRRGNRSPS